MSLDDVDKAIHIEDSEDSEVDGEEGYETEDSLPGSEVGGSEGPESEYESEYESD